jgi:hypothetical protein
MLARAVYFSTVKREEEVRFEAVTILRDTGFEPQLVEEPAEKRRQGNRIREDMGLIIKPKSVDINLTVRMIEDAQRGLYDRCFLATSDIDYLPAIEAVRRMGKNVYVLGYGTDIGTNSPFRYVPDAFVDIGTDFMRKWYAIDQNKISSATTYRSGSLLIDRPNKAVTADLLENDKKAVNRTKDAIDKLCSKLDNIGADPSLLQEGITPDAGKVNVLKRVAQQVTTAIDAFDAADKNLT